MVTLKPDDEWISGWMTLIHLSSPKILGLVKVERMEAFP